MTLLPRRNWNLQPPLSPTPSSDSSIDQDAESQTDDHSLNLEPSTDDSSTFPLRLAETQIDVSCLEELVARLGISEQAVRDSTYSRTRARQRQSRTIRTRRTDGIPAVRRRIPNGYCSERATSRSGSDLPTLDDVVVWVWTRLAAVERAAVSRAYGWQCPARFRLVMPTPVRALAPVLKNRLDGYGVESMARSTCYDEGPPPSLAIHYSWPFLTRRDRAAVIETSPIFGPYAGLRFRACTRDLKYLALVRPKLAETKRLDPVRMRDMAAAALTFDFYHPDFLRFLGNEYTGERRDWRQVAAILDTTRDVEQQEGAPPVDYDAFWDMITQGAPLRGHFQCSSWAVAQRNIYNNHPAVKENFSEIRKKFGEEEAKSFHILLPRFIWRFINGCHLSFVNWVPPRLRPPREGRIIIDPTSHLRDPVQQRPQKSAPRPPLTLMIGHSEDHKYRRRHERGELFDNGAPNDRIPKAGKEGYEKDNPKVHYGSAMRRTLEHIWSLRAKYPSEDILMLIDDVSAAFRWVTYHPVTSLAFCTVLGDMLVIPVTQTFGTRSSPSFYMIPAEIRAHVAVTLSFDTVSAVLCRTLMQPALPDEALVRTWPRARADAAQPLSRLTQSPNERACAPFVDDTNNVHTRTNVAACVNASILAAYIVFAFPGESRLPPPINAKKWVNIAHWLVHIPGFRDRHAKHAHDLATEQEGSPSGINLMKNGV